LGRERAEKKTLAREGGLRSKLKWGALQAAEEGEGGRSGSLSRARSMHIGKKEEGGETQETKRGLAGEAAALTTAKVQRSGKRKIFLLSKVWDHKGRSARPRGEISQSQSNRVDSYGTRRTIVFTHRKAASREGKEEGGREDGRVKKGGGRTEVVRIENQPSGPSRLAKWEEELWSIPAERNSVFGRARSAARGGHPYKKDASERGEVKTRIVSALRLPAPQRRQVPGRKRGKVGTHPVDRKKRARCVEVGGLLGGRLAFSGE